MSFPDKSKRSSAIIKASYPHFHELLYKLNYIQRNSHQELVLS
nr:MAG TPA: hypothetical protein [Caudoviricetes sp.]